MIVGTTAPADPLYGVIPPEVWITKDWLITNTNVIAQLGLDASILNVTEINCMPKDEAAVLDLITQLEELGYRPVILVRGHDQRRLRRRPGPPGPEPAGDRGVHP